MRETFRRPRYILFAVFIALVVFALSVWLPNLKLLLEISKSSRISFLEKAAILTSFAGSIKTNFTPPTAFLTGLVALLFGVNAALLARYFSKKKKAAKAGALGLSGLFLGLLGVGCASCGTFILTSVLTLTGGAAALALLPLSGAEFGILGVLLLVVSVFLTAKEVEKAPVCD